MRHAKHWTGLLSVGVAGAMLALPAYAQDAPAAAPERTSVGALESITVKGTKRETDQQETPLAVSTITDQQLVIGLVVSPAELARTQQLHGAADFLHFLAAVVSHHLFELGAHGAGFFEELLQSVGTGRVGQHGCRQQQR